MSTRIKNLFKKSKVFASYITVGDGDSVSIANALIAGGVNLLELGVPFSDPVADGEVIQRAAERALKKDTSLFDVLNVAKKIRETSDVPLILFGYFNPFLHANPSQWLAKASASGIDGVLVVDLPLEESDAFYKQCKSHGIAPISIITPATDKERLKKITRHADGFLYYAMRKGTTGIRNGLPESFVEKIAEIKTVTHLPILAGFGVSNAEDAKKILMHADGFVVGSFFVKAIEEGISLDMLTQIAAKFVTT